MISPPSPIRPGPNIPLNLPTIQIIILHISTPLFKRNLLLLKKTNKMQMKHECDQNVHILANKCWITCKFIGHYPAFYHNFCQIISYKINFCPAFYHNQFLLDNILQNQLLLDNIWHFIISGKINFCWTTSDKNQLLLGIIWHFIIIR